MDAKPQRPRTLRAHDENMLPSAMPVKTLHQRTKSVPAFSTLKKEILKQVPVAAEPLGKTVLGKVNPNLKVLQASKDDLMIMKTGNEPEKDAGKLLFKANSVEVKDTHSTAVVAAAAAALARPALRPQSTKQVSAPMAPTLPSLSAVLPKKSVMVLKDESSMPEPHAHQLPVKSEPEASIEPPAELALVKQTEAEQSAPPTSAMVYPLAQVTGAVDQHFNITSYAADKQFVFDLEKQAEYFDTYEYQTSALLPTYLPVSDMASQNYYIGGEYDTYDDGYTTRRSFGLSSESTCTFNTIIMPKLTEKFKIEVAAAKRYVEALRTPEDVEDELWDTSMVAEYGEEIFAHMHKLEQRMLPDPRYMDKQTEIQWSMRAVLVDWVVQVHQRLNLLPETLFLAVNYIDRFLTYKVVSLGKLQLVGATALFIAAKFEEVNSPGLQDVIFMVDNGYTVDELLKAERFMLSMLQFDLGWPGPMSFLRRVSKADDYDLETRTLAKYFLEVTIMDERFIGCTPSYIAAGAHCLARLMLRKGEWTVAHVAYSDYTYAQLRPLLNGMMECCDTPRRHHASVYDKYADKRYKSASTFVEAEILKGFSVHQRLSFHHSPYGPRPAIDMFT